MVESIKSILKLDELFFSEIVFERKDSFSDYSEDDVDIGIGKDYNIEGNTLGVKLAIRACLPDHFDLKVVVSAKFTVSGDNPKPEMFVKNAIAIMFPYIRSEVTLLTSQPNLKPIMIPPVNINALIEYYENKNKNE